MPQSYIEIDSAKTAEALLSSYAGHWKIYSWLCLMSLGVPTPSGVIVTSWNDVIRQKVERFMDARGWDGLLLRSDRDWETGRYPRGGFVVPKHDLTATVEGFLELHRILFLLEPLSPFEDLYSLNLAYWPEDQQITVEIMGPGFDASDIKRGDLTPHETYELAYPAPSDKLQVLHHETIDSSAYEASVQRRLSKISWLANPTESPSSQALEAGSQKAGRETLERLQKTLLLEHAERYAPIPRRLLAGVFRQTLAILRHLPQMGAPRPPLVISMVYLQDERPVYWDIVWPHLKYQGVNS